MRPRDWTAWRGHVRTSHCWKRRESPQPVRALAAGLQSPEGHTEPGPAPWTAGDHCSQSIQTRHATPPPAQQQHRLPGPRARPLQRAGKTARRGLGRKLFRGSGPSLGASTLGQRDGETERGRRPQRLEAGVGRKTEKTPYVWGRRRGAPQETTHCLEETSLPSVSHLWCLHAYSSSVPPRSSINTCRRTLITRQALLRS